MQRFLELVFFENPKQHKENTKQQLTSQSPSTLFFKLHITVYVVEDYTVLHMIHHTFYSVWYQA